MNQYTLNQIKLKHPSPSRSLNFPTHPNAEISLQVSETDVKNSIMSFANGSAPGMDGFRPQFFKDLISISALHSGNEALSTITNFCNFVLKGKVNDDICIYIYGASLCALMKNDGEFALLQLVYLKGDWFLNLLVVM